MKPDATLPGGLKVISPASVSEAAKSFTMK